MLLFKDREAGVRTLHVRREEVAQDCTALQPDDLRARNHDFVDPPVAEREDTGEELRLVALEHARLGALSNEQADLLLRVDAVRTAFDDGNSERPKQRVCQTI